MVSIRRSSVFLITLIIAIGVAQGDEQTQISLPPHEIVSLKFTAFDPARVLIDEQAVLKEFLLGMQKRSQWPVSFKSGIVGHLSGFRAVLDAPQSRVRFEYVSLDQYSSGKEYGQTLSITAPYAVTRTDEDFVIRLGPFPPGEFVTRSSHGIFRVPTPQLNPPDELVRDFDSILDAAPHIELIRQCVAKGEKTSSYKPEAIVGNFERLLGRYVSATSNGLQATGVDRRDVFAYLLGQSRIPLTISAVPYRDGTKVIYEAPIPYTVRADGTFEGYDLPGKLSTDVDRILAD